MQIDAESKAIPTSFLEIERRRRTLIGVVDWRKKDSKKNSEVIRTQALWHLPGAVEDKSKGAKKMSGEE